MSVLLNKGYGAFDASSSYPVGQYASDLAAVDLNGDGMPELVCFADGVSLLVNAGDGTFQPALDYPAGPGPYAGAVVDVDGKPALAVLNSGDVTVIRTTCIE